jgi:hypothetical protein
MPSYFIFVIDYTGKERPAGVWTNLPQACWAHSGQSGGKALKGIRYEMRDSAVEGSPTLMKETLSARDMRAKAREWTGRG